MSDAFTPQVRVLLDRLEPPALPADFADRLVAIAEAKPSLPPLPPVRAPRRRGGRRIVLALGVASLVGMAAAAAVVPADVWRKVPVIGGIVELISPAKHAPPPARSEAAPVTPARVASESAMPVAEQPEAQPLLDVKEAPRPPEDRAAASPKQPLAAKAESTAVQPEPTERPREVLAQPVRDLPVSEPPAAAAREASATVAPADPAPARTLPADRIESSSETRQQVRERTTTTRQTPTRERIERRERRTSSQRAN